MYTFKTPAMFLAIYEKTARNNRPDWADFIVEAKSDKYNILFEVMDTIADRMPDFWKVVEHNVAYFDDLLLVTFDWVNAL